MGGIVRIEEEIRRYAERIPGVVLSEDSLREFLIRIKGREPVEYTPIGCGSSPEGFVLIEVAYLNPCRGIEKRCRSVRISTES